MIAAGGGPLKITFLLPFLNWTGGIRVMCEYAERLELRGHRVELIFPLIPYRFGDRLHSFSGFRRWSGDLRLNLRRGARLGARPLRAPVRMVPWFSKGFLPDADVLVCSAWPTAESAAALSPRKGRVVYLIQHREVDSGPEEQVDATYRLPHFRVAGSRFTAGVLLKTPGVEVEAVVANGLDTDFWSPPPADREGRRKGILMFYSSQERKGGVDGLVAIEKIHRAHPACPIHFYGARRTAAIPTYVEFHESPPDQELRELYRETGVFLYPSRYEGFGLPPMEAMGCGAAVVSTRVGAVDEFTAEGTLAVLVDPGDVEGLASGAMILLADPTRRSDLGRRGAAHVQKHSLAQAVEEFEAALFRATSRTGEGEP